MKVLRVVSDISPFVSGGIGMHTYEMSRLQNLKKSIDLTVLTFSKIGTFHKFPFKTILVNQPPRIFGNAISLKFFKKLWNLWEKFDIIHAHSHMFLTTNMCAFIKLFKKKKLIITNHGLYSQSAPKWLQEIFMRTLWGFSLRMADIVLCYTSEEARELVKKGVSLKKIKIIHNGINTKKFYPLGSKFKNKRFTLLWVGRFVEGKNIKGLLNIIRGVKHATFITVGKGPLKDYFLDQVKKENLNVQHHDFIKNDSLNKIYNKSHVFILPSFEEGFPRTIIEAMSCGLPIICSNLPQIKKTASNCGFLADPRSPSEFVKACLMLSKEVKKRKKMGRLARKKILKNYNFNETVSKVNEVYLE